MAIHGTGVGQGRYNDSTLPNSTIGRMQPPPESPSGGDVQRLCGSAPVCTYYIYVCSATDIGSVNAVETRFIASLQPQPQPASVQTRCIASPPYFPPYLTDKTTSVTRRTSTSVQPYYLIPPLHRINKVIRLAHLCAQLATEVVLLWIRPKIRYDATTAGIP